MCGPRVYPLLELVRLAARAQHLRRIVLPLGPTASYLLARLLELKPGRKLMTRDNYYAMQTDNVCTEGFPARFGRPTALESCLDELVGDLRKGAYYDYRETARR